MFYSSLKTLSGVMVQTLDLMPGISKISSTYHLFQGMIIFILTSKAIGTP